MSVTQEILEQLDGLIQEGNRLNSSYRMRDMGQLESDLPESDFRSFATATLATVERIAGRNSEYHHCLPLVDTNDPLSLPGYNNTKIPAMIGALVSLRQAVDKGLLVSMESRLRASIHDDLFQEAKGASNMRRIGAMIGSPSDASEERQAITDAILRWNAVNRDKGIIIEPVRWETHATPGLQGRPQGMINAELVPISDILVAVFRGRAGSPTGKELSGTIEEIREFMRLGKYVVLYFYEGEVAIGKVDPDQLKTINDFKKEIQQHGLTVSYENIGELREHIICHLTSIVGKLPAPDDSGSIEQDASAAGQLNGTSTTVETPVAKLKRCIVDDGSRIELDDLITQETEQARQAVFDAEFLKTIWPIQADSLARWLKECEARMDTLLHLYILGCRWGKPEHHRLWIRSLERLGSISPVDFDNASSSDLIYYPALLLLYGGGMAAVTADDYALLNGLLSVATCSIVQRSWSRDTKAAWIVQMLYNYADKFTCLKPNSGFPVSDYLHELLRDPLRLIEPDDRRYDKRFDWFECLSAISYADTFGDRHMLIGRFGRHFWYPEAGNIMEEIEIELQRHGDNWPPLKGGICGGSVASFRKLKQQLDEAIKNTRRP